MGYIWIHETSGTSRYVDAKYLPPCNTCGKQLDLCTKHDKENDNGKDGITVRGDDEANGNVDN